VPRPGALLAVLAGLADDLALGLVVLAGAIGLAHALGGRGIGLLELADLVVGAADLRARGVVVLARRDLLALGLALEVGLLGVRLLGDVAVLVGQVLRVVGRLVDLVLVRRLHHHHVRRRLHGRRSRRL